MIFRFAASLCLALGLTGCFSSQITLDYQPRPGMHVTGRPVATAGRFYGGRGTNPWFIGHVDPSISTAQETLFLRVPADEAVRNAVLHALQARNLLKETGAAYYIAGEVEELNCRLTSRPTASARVRIHVLDSRNDKILFARTYAHRRHAANWQSGFYDPVPVLRELASRALQDVIDQALDDPALRRVMRPRSPRTQGKPSPDTLPLTPAPPGSI